MKEIAKQKDYLNDKYIIKYIDYIKFEKRLSENTIKSYLNDIEKLYSYNKNYYKFTSKDINKYLENLDYLDNRSVAHLITVLRSLYAFLNKEGIISHNPCNNIIIPKLGAKLPNYLTIEEVNKLLDVNLVKPNDYRNKAMLELCFAIALPALGSAILFNIGSSSGGTDIIAMIIKKYSSFDIGKALLISDILITVAGCFVFDIKTGLYSFLGLAVRSFMIDNFIESFNLSKYFNVVCDDPQPICNFIVNELNRSATVVDAQGAFTGNEKYIIFTALNRPQAIKLRNYIKENQPTAFILISNTSEIIGKGFHSV